MKIVSVFLMMVLTFALTLPLHAQREIPEVAQKEVTLPSGVKYVDLIEGEGTKFVRGQKIAVDYVGTLEETGEEFDNSYRKGKPLEYYHMVNHMIPGWNEGISGMKVGGKRRIIVPSAYGYGSKGTATIPPNSVLVFVIEVRKAGDVLSRP